MQTTTQKNNDKISFILTSIMTAQKCENPAEKQGKSNEIFFEIKSVMKS